MLIVGCYEECIGSCLGDFADGGNDWKKCSFCDYITLE